MNILSPLLAFFAVAFMVEIGLALFRVKRHRVQTYFRLLPFFSMLLDTFFSFFHWLNPFTCGSCMQKLLLLLFPQLQPHLDLSFFFIPFWTLSVIFLLFKGYSLLKQMRELKAIVQEGRPFNLPLSAVDLQGVKVLISDAVEIPMALYSQTILLPAKIEETPYEAVIAHELEHLKWKDPYVRLFMQLVLTLYWWVPAGSWIKRVEQEQEMACDRAVLNYGYDAESLASTLLTFSKQSHTLAAPCSFADKTHSSLLRIKAIFDELPSHTLNKLALIGLILGAIVWILCK